MKNTKPPFYKFPVAERQQLVQRLRWIADDAQAMAADVLDLNDPDDRTNVVESCVDLIQSLHMIDYWLVDVAAERLRARAAKQKAAARKQKATPRRKARR